jgi:hypothetical protein
MNVLRASTERLLGEGLYIIYFISILMLLTELNLTNGSQPVIKRDSPPHLTSPRRGEGFFPYLRREKSSR